MKLRIRSYKSTSQAGFSLTELMIAITVGMLITAGLAGVFASNIQARGEVERTNRQVENGRYAMQVLSEDLRLAGYLGELDPTNLTTPAANPDPCATALVDLRSAMPVHIQGYDNGGTIPSCLSDVRSDTDILVIRRASSCLAGVDTDCDPVSAGIPYFQASNCYPVSGATELAGDVNSHYALNTDTSALTLRQRNCTTVANLRRYRTHIYFVANNNTSGDSIPTLKRAELDASGSGTSIKIVPLVEGIENLQVEYGIDTDAIGGTNAGSPNVYTADPGAFNACAGQACVNNWRGVVAVKVHLLARNTDPSVGHTDSKTYSLGLKADSTTNTVGPFSDRYKRHIYQSSMRLINPAGRREP